MTGREICIKNDWRIGDILNHTVEKMSCVYTEEAIITAIGSKDVILLNPNGIQEEYIGDLDMGDWKLARRPRKLVGFAFRYSTYLRTPAYPSIPSLKAMEGLSGSKGKLVSVWKVASKTRIKQKWQSRKDD